MVETTGIFKKEVFILMRTLWEVSGSEWKNESLYLLMEQTRVFQNIKAGDRMLAHSDELAFIYILEKDDEFIYLVLPSIIWGDLKQALDQQSKVFLKGENQDLELTSFENELSYLIENIEGNSNYGNEMVKKVEEILIG